jgi:hypothetical protein
VIPRSTVLELHGISIRPRPSSVAPQTFYWFASCLLPDGRRVETVGWQSPWLALGKLVRNAAIAAGLAPS